MWCSQCAHVFVVCFYFLRCIGLSSKGGKYIKNFNCHSFSKSHSWANLAYLKRVIQHIYIKTKHGFPKFIFGISLANIFSHFHSFQVSVPLLSQQFHHSWRNLKLKKKKKEKKGTRPKNDFCHQSEQEVIQSHPVWWESQRRHAI